MRKLKADMVFPIDASPVQDGVVVIDDEGKILSIDNASMHDASELESYKGWILPGFVNTHCHMELSHMLGKVDTGTGLIPFISAVVKERDIDQSAIEEAIKKADEQMQKEGIVAVGDISNKSDTANVKASSNIRYYTFVEMFDFMQSNLTQSTIDQYSEVLQNQSAHGFNKKNLVPHAPYTVSPELFKYIEKHTDTNDTISIHNQETLDENLLFQSKTGNFLPFFESFGMSMNDFEPSRKGSIHYAMEHMNPEQKILFVHNTLTSDADIKTAHAWGKHIYWATCANANLYIENKLPDYKLFMENNAKLTIGTDSLTSNWQLSILEEIKTINRYQSYIPVDTLFRWATLNGAEALSYEEDLGSITIGKVPGINLLECQSNGAFDIQKASVRKLV